MSRWKWFVAALIVVAGLTLSFAPAQIVARGAYWDTDLWDAYTIADDSTAVCRLLPDGSIGCQPLRAGTVVLIPTLKATD